MQLISKCGIQMPSENRDNSIKHYDYSKSHIIESVEQSLKNLQTDYLDVFYYRPSPLMQADEIAEAVEELKSEGKIIDFDFQTYVFTDGINTSENRNSYNQVQFSATNFEPMLDGSFDYMQMHSIRPMSWNPLGCIFRKDIPQTHRLKNLATLVSKYHLGSTRFCFPGFETSSKSNSDCRNVNVARIQSLMKAVDLELEKEDWFAIWAESMGKEVP
jgi:predicted oxidoreductase